MKNRILSALPRRGAFSYLALSISAVLVLPISIFSAPHAESAAQPVPASAADLLNKGLDESLQGDFDAALNLLQEAKKLSPRDERIYKALDMITSYTETRRNYEAEALRRYRYELKRIERLRVAEDYLPELDKADFASDLRETVKTEFIEAYELISPIQNIEAVDNKEALELKRKGREALEKLPGIVDKAVAFFDGNTTAFAREFRKVCDNLKTTLRKFSRAWPSMRFSRPLERWQSMKEMYLLERELSNAVTDMEAMVSEKPWKVALLHARLAKRIFPGDMQSEPWLDDYIRWIEDHAAAAKKNGEWNDLLAASNTLEEIAPLVPAYGAMVLEALKHVRVIQLYGANKSEADDEKEEDSPPEPDIPYWKKLTREVDAQMVRRAISKLKSSYVSEIDFLELNRSALNGVAILARTPEVFETFPGLKNAKMRKEFIAGIRSRIEEMERKDRVDGITLQRSLNWILSHSEGTVHLPTEVAIIEFAHGFLAKLDKFSRMIWPYNMMEFNKSTMGHFTGIGVQVMKEPGEPLKIVTPLMDSPALEAGLKAGDLILKVDGHITKDKQIDTLVNKITGKENTTVTLTVRRRGRREPFDVSVVRKHVNIRTIDGWRRREDGDWSYRLETPLSGTTGYIRIKQFTETSHDAIRNILREFAADGVDSLVLDLRDNPGGLLTSAAAITDEFIDSGTVVYTKGRMQRRRSLTAHGDGSYVNKNNRVAILVNEHTASAAEIVSGALQCLGRAMVIGERSYGKGSVQNLIRVMGDEALLKLTTAYYYLQNGRLLHRKPHSKDWGINPNIAVPLSPRRRSKMYRLQRETGLLRKYDPDLKKSKLDELYEADLQLQTAVLILKLQKLKDSLSPSAPAVAGHEQPS